MRRLSITTIMKSCTIKKYGYTVHGFHNEFRNEVRRKNWYGYISAVYGTLKYV